MKEKGFLELVRILRFLLGDGELAKFQAVILMIIGLCIFQVSDRIAIAIIIVGAIKLAIQFVDVNSE